MGFFSQVNICQFCRLYWSCFFRSCRYKDRHKNILNCRLNWPIGRSIEKRNFCLIFFRIYWQHLISHLLGVTGREEQLYTVSCAVHCFIQDSCNEYSCTPLAVWCTALHNTAVISKAIQSQLYSKLLHKVQMQCGQLYSVNWSVQCCTQYRCTVLHSTEHCANHCPAVHWNIQKNH